MGLGLGLGFGFGSGLGLGLGVRGKADRAARLVDGGHVKREHAW